MAGMAKWSFSGCIKAVKCDLGGDLEIWQKNFTPVSPVEEKRWRPEELVKNDSSDGLNNKVKMN